MAPDGNSGGREIRATLNRLRSGPDESVALPVSAACHPLNDYGVKPRQHQRLGVDDATMRCFVLNHKGPWRTPIEVLAEIRVRSFCAGDAVRAASEDELRDRCRFRSQVDGFETKWVVARMCGHDRQKTVGSVGGEPTNQRPRSGEAEQNQFGR